MCMNDDDDKCNSPTVVNPHFKHAVDLKACASLVRHVTVKPCKNMNMRETKLSFFFALEACIANTQSLLIMSAL